MAATEGMKFTREETFLSRLISIRVVLVSITVVTVLCLAVGLISLNVLAQNDLVDHLSHKIIDGVSDTIVNEVLSLFEFTDEEGNSAKRIVYSQENLTIPSNATNPFISLRSVADQLMNIVVKRPIGINVELSFFGANGIGLESYNYVADVYWATWDTDYFFSNTMWAINLNETISSVNFTIENAIYYSGINTTNPANFDTAELGLYACDSPDYWLDLAFFFLDGTFEFTLMGKMTAACNAEGVMLGYIGMHLGLQSITEVLRNITTTLKGKAFIMDHQEQLVASSTNTPIFSLDLENFVVVRHTTENTGEQWIKQVAEKLEGNLENQRRETTINGTDYYLSVTNVQYATVKWIIVTLLERDQFLGNYRYYFINSIVATAVISAISLAVVLIVTWMTTKPLFILALELRKMSQLDLDISDLDTPRLLEVGRLYHSVVSMYIALRSFKKFVPVSIISNIIKTKKEAALVLAPAEVTVMFQDIEGFTSLSEKIDPMTLARLTGEYMECMTEIICKNGGTIDKYIGDCIMSIFNAPENLPNHAEAAAIAAIECQQLLEKKNVEWTEKYGRGLSCRIGINTGKVLVGNLGSELRMNYTVIGDNVNIAARLEGVNKKFGTHILVSKSTKSGFTKGKIFCRKLSKVRVSGKASATTIFEVRPPGPSSAVHLFSCYEDALQHFKHRDFSGALDILAKCLEIDPTDNPSLLLKERIEELENSPLPPTWSYVDNLLKM